MEIKDNKAVGKSQIELLKKLMSLEELSEYCLVGGTNLALRYEHRISIDLDIFRYNPSANIEENMTISNMIKKVFPTAEIISINKIGIFLYIGEVKVDIIEYPFPFFEVETIKGIRLASKSDISAMKISAITNRGSRKDFYDLHELLKEFTLKEIFDNYQRKYNIDNLEMAKRSLIYFEDANNEKERNNKVISLINESWENIKDDIERKYNELFQISHKNRQKK